MAATGIGVGRAAFGRTPARAAVDRRAGRGVRYRPLRPGELRCLVEPPRFRRPDDRLRTLFVFQGPTDRRFRGIAAYRDLLATLFAAFPDLELQVDEVYWMGNEVEGFLVSVRWSAVGTHASAGIYGPATSFPVQIWGITQQQIVNRRIVAEWMLFNELDLMMQLAIGAVHDV